MDVYEIVKTIGSGSFGQVYMARHTRENKNYVIKRVKTRDMNQKDLENTENEVRLLQKIRHTNIVAYKDSYVDREQYLNIVMIYCDGGDIYSKIKNAKGKNFPENTIIDWLVQMALALLYLHERKILHRDMKTQNIFLKNGKIRLGDFGIAKVLDSTRDFANTCIGTPYYMSPELFKNQPYSYKSDVWALGCVLYEMCNLRHAFDANSINGLAVKILRGSFPPINNCYSKQLRDLIGKMLQVKPKQRPTILDILNKVFVRKRATAYFNECLVQMPKELSPTDVDDMYADSLKDQAEKLMIPGFAPVDNSVGARLSGGGKSAVQGAIKPKRISREQEGSKSPTKKLQSETEKRRELLRLKKELKEKEFMENKLQALEQEAKDKEQQYKEKFQKAEKRRNQLQDAKKEKAIRASNPYAINSNNNQKPGGNKSSANRSSSVPASTKQSSGLQSQVNSSVNGLSGTGTIQENVIEQRAPRHKKPDRSRADKSYERETDELGRPNRRQHASSVHEEDLQDHNNLMPPSGNQSRSRAGSLIKNQDKADNQLLKNSRNNGNISSHNSLVENGPLSTYAEFKNVFNAKNIGGKANRRQAQQAQNSLQDPHAQKQIRTQEENQGQRLLHGSSNSVTGESGPMSARDRILYEKEQKKQTAQNQVNRELDRIRGENSANNRDAHNKNYNQYRTSQDKSLNKSGSNVSLGSDGTPQYRAENLHQMPTGSMSPGMGSIQAAQRKTIEANFQMFDEEEDVNVGKDDGDLEDIIEEVIEEESEDDEEDGEGDFALASQEFKDQKRENRQELKALRTQLLNLKEQISEKTFNINTIRSNLKKSQVKITKPQDGRQSPGFVDVESTEDFIIDQTVRNLNEEDLIEPSPQDQEDETYPTGGNTSSDAEDYENDYGQEQRPHIQLVDADVDEQSSSDSQGEDQMYQSHETDPQILKLQDKIRLYKHRCVASLGYNLYEKAFDYLKSCVVRGISTEERRNGLIGIVGQESIGFWAILDQILFFDDLVNELQRNQQQTQEQQF